VVTFIVEHHSYIEQLLTDLDNTSEQYMIPKNNNAKTQKTQDTQLASPEPDFVSQAKATISRVVAEWRQEQEKH
jgi:hypothetical protein